MLVTCLLGEACLPSPANWPAARPVWAAARRSWIRALPAHLILWGGFGLRLCRYLRSNLIGTNHDGCPQPHQLGQDPATEPTRRVCGALHENKNVGGGAHDCDVSKTQTPAAARPALGPRFLTEPPLADIESRAHLR
jgi:hypothetical protein